MTGYKTKLADAITINNGSVFIEYTVGKKSYGIDCTWDSVWNKKRERFEHLHIGKRGGEVLIVSERNRLCKFLHSE